MSRFTAEDYAIHYGSGCRDCADANGICPDRGIPCNPKIERAVVKKTLEALTYGIKHGFIDNPFAALAQCDAEPAEWQRKSPDRGWVKVGLEDVDFYRSKGQEIRPLYLTPPNVREQWQDISTAPMDGTPVLVCGGLPSEMRVKEADGEWWNSHTCPRSVAPTHWMPLPPAPKEVQPS